MDVEKLMKMADSVRTGGKGSVRRKKKVVHKRTTTDTLKRLIGVKTIPAIKEVNISKGNGKQPSVKSRKSLGLASQRKTEPADDDDDDDDYDIDIADLWESWHSHNHDLCIKSYQESMQCPPFWWETKALHIEVVDDDDAPPAVLSDEEYSKMLYDSMMEREARFRESYSADFRSLLQ